MAMTVGPDKMVGPGETAGLDKTVPMAMTGSQGAMAEKGVMDETGVKVEMGEMDETVQPGHRANKGCRVQQGQQEFPGLTGPKACREFRDPQVHRVPLGLRGFPVRPVLRVLQALLVHLVRLVPVPGPKDHPRVIGAVTAAPLERPFMFIHSATAGTRAVTNIHEVRIVRACQSLTSHFPGISG